MHSAAWRMAILRALVWAGLIALSVCLWWLIGRVILAVGPLSAPSAVM